MSHPTRYVLEGLSVPPEELYLNEALPLMPAFVAGMARHELWKRLDDDEWEQFKHHGNPGQVIVHPDGLRRVAVSDYMGKAPPRRWGGLRRPAPVPDHAKGTALLPEGPLDIQITPRSIADDQRPIVAWHPQQRLTRDALQTLFGTDAHTLEQVSADGRMWLIRGMGFEPSPEQLQAQRLHYTIDAASALDCLGPQGAKLSEEFLGKMNIQRHWQELILATSIVPMYKQSLTMVARGAEGMPALVARQYRAFGERMPDNRYQLRGVSRGAYSHMAMPMGNYLKDDSYVSRVLTHEFSHFLINYVPDNIFFLEGTAEAGTAAVDHMFDKRLCDALGRSACQVLYGPALEECGCNVGDGMSDMDLGAMKAPLAWIAAQRIFHHWMDGSERKLRTFFRACNETGTSARTPTTEEWLAHVEKVLPGFSDRVRRDPLLQPAKDRTHLLFFPRIVGGKRTGGVISAYSFRRNPNAGKTFRPVPTYHDPESDDFDWRPGVVTDLPYTLHADFGNAGKMQNIPYAGKTTIDVGEFRTFLEKRNISVPSTCRLRLDFTAPDSDGTQHIDLGEFDL